MSEQYEIHLRKTRNLIKLLNTPFENVMAIARQQNQNTKKMSDEELIEIYEKIREQLKTEGII